MTSNIYQLETTAGSFRVAVDGAEDAPALILSNSLRSEERPCRERV